MNANAFALKGRRDTGSAFNHCERMRTDEHEMNARHRTATGG